jgi:hypothetical protein
MKLSEMATTSAKKINKVLESRFGFAIDYDTLSITKAQRLGETISQNLNKIRHSADFHTAETNPRYMELLTVQEGINTWLTEQHQQLNEGEVGDAEVLLAAKDMVDSIQDQIEKVGKMQNEQLPQLLDSIRDQLGSEQADAFKNAVGVTLDTLMAQLQVARNGIDTGVRVLSGDQADQPMELGNTPAPAAPDMAAEIPVPASDFDQEEGGADGFAATDAANGGTETLGREVR